MHTLTFLFRPHDIDERTSRISYGLVLWQLRYHGYLQLKRNWAAGKGRRILEAQRHKRSKLSCLCQQQ
jgi:hypothetical protein